MKHCSESGGNNKGDRKPIAFAPMLVIVSLRLVQRAPQVVEAVQLRRQRQHRVAVAAGKRLVDAANNLGRGQLVIHTRMRGVKQGRNRSSQQDLRSPGDTASALEVQRVQQGLVVITK